MKLKQMSKLRKSMRSRSEIGPTSNRPYVQHPIDDAPAKLVAGPGYRLEGQSLDHATVLTQFADVESAQSFVDNSGRVDLKVVPASELPSHLWLETEGSLGSGGAYVLELNVDKMQVPERVQKAGPFIGPKGGKWADAQHTIPWKDRAVAEGSRDHTAALAEHIKKLYGVKLNLSHSDDTITLSRMVVPKDRRNEGVGSKVMEAVHRYADKHGKTVALTPSSDFGGSKTRLKRFYKRHGYVENKGRNKDYEISEEMYRPPKQLSKAGNGSPHKLHYRTTFQGLPISIENRKGSKRYWTDHKTGEEGSTKMEHPYGYIRGYIGRDGDEIDVFLGPNEDSNLVFIVNQRQPDDLRRFDEHKVMLGFDSLADAKKAYLKHYDERGPSFMGSLRMWTMGAFKKWLEDGNLKKPAPVRKSLSECGEHVWPLFKAGGWQPIPKGKKGGYRRRTRDGWEYWYPERAGKKKAPEGEISDRLLSRVVDHDEADASWVAMTEVMEQLDKDLKAWGEELGHSGKVARKAAAKKLAALKEKTLAKIPPPRVVKVAGLRVETIASSVEQHAGEMIHEAFEWRERALSEKYEGKYVWPGKDLRESFGYRGVNKEQRYGTFYNLGRGLKGYRETPVSEKRREEERNEWTETWKRTIRASLRDVAALPDSHRELLEAANVRTRFLVHTSTEGRVFVGGEATVDRRLKADTVLMYAFSGLGKDDPEQGVTLTHEVGHMVDRIVRRSLTPKGDYANEDHDLSKLFLGQVDAEAVRNKPEDDKDVESDRHWMRSPTEWFAEAYRYAYRDGFEMLTKLDHTDFDTKAFRELVDRKVSEAVSKGVHRLAKAMFYVPLQKAGWQPIPGGKKGGKRRPKPGGGYEYWYPEQKGGGPSKKPTFDWGESKWTEAELRAGDFDKDPSHWHGYQKVKGQPPIGWTKGGVVPSSNHPVKEKGLPHRLFQIVEPNADQGWAKLKDVNNGEERIVAHDRVIPVYHDAKKKPPKKDKSKEEPWTPGGDKGKGGQVSGTSKKARRIPAYEDSNAKKGTALAAMESGVFMRHREVAYEPDAHGTPRRVEREKTYVDSLTKEKLISEFGPLIAKQAKKIKKAFGLKSRYTDNIGGRAIDETLADLRASAIEGLLVATERYEGGSAFAPYAKHYVRDYTRMHAAREFAGGVTIPRRFARMLDGYIAARAKAMQHFGDDPSPEQVAHVWDLRKRHVHTGITKDDPQHAEPVPMGAYKLKKKKVITDESGKRKKTTVATDTKTQPGKLDLAEQLHTFLTGQATAQGTDFFSDRDAVFPSIHMGVGLSAQEKVEVRASLNKLFEGLRDHQITVTKGRQATDYKADSGEIVDRMLGLSGDLEEQSLNVVAAEVPMYRKVKGEWRQLNHRQAKAMAPVFLDRALDRLREQLGESKSGKLIGRAQDHIRPQEQARRGPTYRQRLQARSRDVSTKQVQEWRANERARLKRLQGRMADRAAEMPAGPARDHQEALLSQLSSARRRIDRMSNREVAMRIAHSKAGEATDQIRRMQTQTVEVDTKDPNSEYGWAVTTLTDPSTGRQRRVRVRTVRAIRPGDEQLTKADTEPLDEAITLDMLRWPRLTALLWGREPIATPSRFELEAMVGLH